MRLISIISFILFATSTVWAAPKVQGAVKTQCRLQWGEAKVSGPAGSCRIQVRRTDKPLLLKWSLPKSGMTSTTLLSFELTVSSMADLSGMEFRLHENGKSEAFVATKLPLFAAESFNWVQSKQPTPVTYSLTHFLSGEKGANSYRELSIYIQTKNKAPLEVNIKNLALVPKKISKGFVSITFDDGYESIKDITPALKANGIKATAYIIREALGKKGYITAKEMCAMAKEGTWGISSHGTIPFTDLPNLEGFVRNDFEDMKADCGGILQPEHVAYPLGQQNASVLEISGKYYKTGRLADSGVETLPPSQNLKLRAVNVTPAMTPEVITKLAQQAVQNGDWLILMFHYIKKDGEAMGDLDYSVSQFTEVAKGLKPLGSQVLTVQQVYSKYTP